MNWKSTAAVSGVGLLATWLGLTPTRFPVADVRPAAAARDTRAGGGVDIEAQAARLQTRVRGEVDYRDPSRNPFRFGTRPPVVPASPPAAYVPPVTAVAAPGADLRAYTVSGMAADVVNGQTNRTAIITTASDVLFVKEGDHVASYTVTAVDDSGVELTAADGVVHRLALTP